MKEFYTKYSEHLGEKVAIKMICKELEKSKDAVELGKDPFVHLAVVHEMITDLFEVVKKVKPELYKFQ